MFGKIEKQKCSECGKENRVELACEVIYEDDLGVFYCTGIECVCGHVLNSERLKNAKVVGAICF